MLPTRRLLEDNEMVKASKSRWRWRVPCEARLVVVLEGSAEVMGWWLLLWEWGIALHLLQKGCFSLFGISRITIPDFTGFSL